MELYSLTPVQLADRATYFWGNTLSNHRSRAVRALHSTGHLNLSVRIANCSTSARCSSIYCGACRHRFVKQAQTRMLARAQSCGRQVDQRLRFLTILVDLKYPVPRDVKRAISEARQKLKALSRKHKELWMQGAFEFELMDVPSVLALNTRSRKRKTILELTGGGKLSPSLFGRMVLVHLHCLVDLDGTNESELKRSLKSLFPGRWMVRLQRTWSDQAIDEKCWKIASYLFKDRTRFNHSDETSGFKQGVLMNDQELSSLIALYSDCSSNGIKHLLIGMGGRR